MKQLLVGDCHFGTHSNSVTWLEQQLNFFNTCFIETLDNKEIDRVVFLGDLFDIRYSINQQVGVEVKELIRKLVNKYQDIDFFFLAGNHDYFSPLEEFHSYNSFELVFGEEFVKCHPNVRIINNEPYYDGHGNLYLPWYYTENFNNFTDTVLPLKNELVSIFCHDDLVQWDFSKLSSIGNAHVWSGHIHYIVKHNNPMLHNVGSLFAFTFNDVNSDKFMFLVEDNKIIDKIENNVTPKFKRFKNEEIFLITEEDVTNSFVELWIFNSNINKMQYKDRVNEIKMTYSTACSIKTKTIDDSLSQSFELSYFNANIDVYIQENIPTHLNDKYIFIKEKLENKEDEK